MQVVMAEEFLRLLVPNAAVDEHQAVADFDKQGAHGPRAQILAVAGLVLDQSCLGTTPNMAPPSSLKFPV